jgi:hypothetical protein
MESLGSIKDLNSRFEKDAINARKNPVIS